MSSWLIVAKDIKTGCERVKVDVGAVYRSEGHEDEHVM
jgi:hypothetical protein